MVSENRCSVPFCPIFLLGKAGGESLAVTALWGADSHLWGDRRKGKSQGLLKCPSSQSSAHGQLWDPSPWDSRPGTPVFSLARVGCTDLSLPRHVEVGIRCWLWSCSRWTWLMIGLGCQCQRLGTAWMWLVTSVSCPWVSFQLKNQSWTPEVELTVLGHNRGVL